MIESSNLEAFCPKLRKGIITPKGNSLLYQTEEPFDQIHLPIESIQYLLHFNGQKSLRDIVASIYSQGGAIYFKSLFKTVMALKERGFLENGSEITKSNWGELYRRKENPILLLKKRWSLRNSITIKKDRPVVFYFLALFLIITSSLGAINGLSHLSSDLALYADDFKVINIVTFILVTSLLLSFKNISKGILVLLLTRRLYNIELVLFGPFFFLKNGSEAVQLISNFFFKSLLFLSSTFCFFGFIEILTQITEPTLLEQSIYWISALSLVLVELNPFSGNELSNFIRTSSQNETLLRVEKYLGESSLAHSMRLGEKIWSIKAHISFAVYALIWTTAGMYLLGMAFNIVDKTFSQIADARFEGLFFYIFIFLNIAYLFLFQIVRLLWLIEFNGKPLIENLVKYFRKNRWRNLSKSQHQTELIPVLENLPLFSEFSHQELLNLIDSSYLLTVESGTEIITKGQTDDDLFVLLAGTLSIYLDTNEKRSGHPPISYIHPTSVFGEWAALEGQPRGAYVFADERSSLLEVPGKVLKEIAEVSQGLSGMENFVKSIMVNQFFSSAPMFKNLSKHLIDLFTSRGKVETIPPKKIICKEGNQGTGFYLILRGKVNVFVGRQKISSIGQGGFFGEISALTDVPCTATITTAIDCVFFRITFAGLRELFCESIEMAMMIESIAEKRLIEDIYVKSRGNGPTTTIRFT